MIWMKNLFTLINSTKPISPNKIMITIIKIPIIRITKTVIIETQETIITTEAGEVEAEEAVITKIDRKNLEICLLKR